MKSEQKSANEEKSDASKLDNRKNYFAIVRGCNSYASLPTNYGSNASPMKSGDDHRTFTGAAAAAMSVNNSDALICDVINTKQTSTEAKSNGINKQWLQMSAATSVTEAALQQLPPYVNLDEESCDDEHSFGLSNDLSTESIKEACERYDDDDDVSDDDLIETNHIPHSFQRSHPLRRTGLSIDRRKKRRNVDEHPLCTLPRSSSSSLASPSTIPAQMILFQAQPTAVGVGQDEVIDVLNELDAVLNGHSASCSMQNALNTDGETKIEDCLLDLDTYLDGIDDEDDNSCSFTNADDCEPTSNAEGAVRAEDGVKGSKNKQIHNKTLPKNLYVFPVTSSSHADGAESRLHVGHRLRRTISSDVRIEKFNNGKAAVPSSTKSNDCLTAGHAADWRRNSMRNTAALASPPTTSGDDANAAPKLAATDSGIREAALLDLAQASRAATGELRRCHSHSSVAPAVFVRTHSTTLASSLSNPPEMLTAANIFENILLAQSAAASSESRPRQFGRRALDTCAGRVLTMDADAFGTSNCMIRGGNQRPTSAPATAIRHSNGSDHSSMGSSRNASPVSLVTNSSTDDSSSTTTLHATPSRAQVSNEDGCRMDASPNGSASDTPLDPDNIQLLTRPGNNSQWPHSFSRILALLSCTLGLFNICRFAVLTVQYGGNFLLQFLLLSVIFGIPLFWLQMCLGAKIKAGPVTMWKISPICKGIGIALTLLQAVLTIYSSIGVAWVLIYLRDSFLEKAHPLYRWQEPFFGYRHSTNTTANLTETVGDYFNGFVLQRLQMVRRSDSSTVRFQVNDRLAFNLALIWTFVFLVLCKGLKSYGKAIVALAIVPLVTLIVVTCKLLTVIDFSTLQNADFEDFQDFLINSKTWSAAAQEAFLTWGLWGPSVIAMSSRLHANAQTKDVLRRDAILVMLTTLLGLSLASLFGLACVQILNENSFIYIPGSYEHMESYTSVYSRKVPLNTALISFPKQWVPHYSSLLGEIYRRPSTVANGESGYQALRLISELFPAAMACSSKSISWIWVATALGMFLVFGLAQLCAMWKPISSALGNSASSVLLSCVTGLLLSIPFSTEIGIIEVYFMDLVVGGSWILPVLWAALIFGVFLIRGRPYNGDDLVNDLRMSGSMSAFLALSWNVLLPIGLITLAIVEYKISNSSQLYHWRGTSYFSLWVRKLASLLQITFLMIVPITALFQILIYLTNGPPDILDRIQLLYRPSQALLDGRVTRSANGRSNSNTRNGNLVSDPGRTVDSQTHATLDDAPPKYTPPPSYTTATGARLAKLLRQSIRRSVRRLINSRTRPEISLDFTDRGSLPPDYTVLHGISENIEIGPSSSVDSNSQQRALSLGRSGQLQKLSNSESDQQRPSSAAPSTDHHYNHHHLSRDRPAGRPYTAEDVATILRASTRRGTERRAAQAERPNEASERDEPMVHRDEAVVYEDDANRSTYSADNLILNAEPLSESAAIATISMERYQEDAQRSSTYSNNEASVI